MRAIHTIIVHHTASPTTTTPAEVEGWHEQRGIRAPGGYHHMLYQGADHRWIYAPMRDPELEGAHDRGQNPGSIGVVVAGDYTRHGWDPAAWDALVQLVTALCHTHGLQAGAVEGHREHEPASTPTACPGWDVSGLREALGYTLHREPLPPHLVAGPPTDAERM